MRKDSIMQVINAYCQTHTLTDLKQGVQGISVYEIAEKLHLLRNNVNVDVNKLFQEGKVIKICGNKMYRFYSQEHFMRVTHKTLPAQTTCSNLNELLGDLHEVRDYEDPFTALIGYNASLKNAILSAKAGILYPGGALHTMLLGEKKRAFLLLIVSLSYLTVPTMPTMQNCYFHSYLAVSKGHIPEPMQQRKAY